MVVPTRSWAIEGITSTRNKLVVALYENVRGSVYDYEPNPSGDWARTRLDLNVDYQLRSNFFLYASAQNIFDVPETLLRFGSQTPGYARGYQVLTTGVQLTLGVKGTF